MIFFIVKNEKPLNMKKIKINIMENKSEKLNSNNAVLISWNEVFENLDELKDAIQYAVNKDNVCHDMISQAIKLYGMDFNSAEIRAIIDNHLLYWAHPLIGNIVNSPGLRPYEINGQITMNWKNLCKYQGPDTEKMIIGLFQKLPKIDRSGRDQVRICQNINELARAFYGEVTSSASRRLEKLLALKLCQSEELHKNQCNILTMFCKNYLEDLNKNISNGNFHMEYCNYYFQGINEIKWTKDKRMSDADRKQTFLAVTELVQLAINKKYNKDNIKILTKDHLDVWTKLPHTLRCAILINDLRKCFKQVASPTKLSMQFSKDKSGYTLGDSAGTNFLPALGFKGGHLLWSWSRDENNPATQTYRYFLCPLWAGPSGHTGGGLAFWKQMLSDKLFNENECAITIASGFFILWRLYYDKRISCNHTLTETFEATWCEEISGAYNKEIINPEQKELVDLSQNGDAFQFIKYQTKINKRQSVDPITLFMHLKKVYFDNIKTSKNGIEAYKNLKTIIDAERLNVSNLGYWLPQWSRELSEKQGLNVQSFAETFSRKLSSVFDRIAGFKLIDKNTKDIIMSYIIKK